jgi:molybdenum cofactor biosynthesis enzyme
MVDVSTKGSTVRIAKASAKVLMQPETLQKIKDNDFKKGDDLPPDFSNNWVSVILIKRSNALHMS